MLCVHKEFIKVVLVAVAHQLNWTYGIWVMLQVTTVVVFVTSARFPRLILIVSALPTYNYLTILQENDVMVGFDSEF